MNSNDFEKKLARQPMRAVPGEWRARVLREAVAAVCDRRGLAQSERRSQTAATVWWRELLWPRPTAWAGLAAAWVIIAVFHAATPAAPVVAWQMTAPQETIRHFAEQRRELAALLSSSSEIAAPQQPKLPGPRSQLVASPASA
jgi:hypothetical protein